MNADVNGREVARTLPPDFEIVDPSLAPSMLDRIEVALAARDKGLTSERIVHRLAQLIEHDNPMVALRAIEDAMRLKAVTEASEKMASSGRTTIHGDVHFSPNFVALSAVLEQVDPDVRRRVLSAIKGDQVLEDEVS